MPIFQAKNAWKWGEKLTKDNKIVMKSRIDTIQTREPLTNRGMLDAMIKGHEDIRISKDGMLVSKWNANVIRENYSLDYKLSVTRKGLNELFELVTVINKDDVKINRVDIATDININFIENIKLLDFLHKCLIANFKSGKLWSNIDDSDLKISNIRYANQNYNVEFYDKKKESENRHLYDTRLEIRLLKVKSQELEFHIDKCIDLWSASVNNIERVEKVMIEKLIKSWHEEKQQQPNLKFTSFTYKYSHYFYTDEILKSVYRAVGLKQNLKSWLYKLRKTYKLDLYSKKDIENLTKEIVKSLKIYKKL